MEIVHAPSARPLCENPGVGFEEWGASYTLTLRRGFPTDTDGYVFTYQSASERRVNTYLVPSRLDVCWVRDGVVVDTETLAPLFASAAVVADCVITLPAGRLADLDVSAGDPVDVVPSRASA